MKVPVLDSLPPRRRKLVLWCVGLLLLYTVLGFLILPPIVRAVAVRQLAKQLDREVSIQKVKLNPFTLSATVRGLLIKDKDGEPFVSFDEAYVNVQLVSLFGHPWVIKEVSTIRPFVHVQMNRDRSFNFSDLLAKFFTNAPSPAPPRPMVLRLGRLRVAAASAVYTDLTPRTPFKHVVGPIDLTLVDFRTDPDNDNPYSFSGTTDAGERFAWSGQFSLDPLGSEGELKVEHTVLNKYAPLYQDLVRFEIKDGTVDASATYRFELGTSNLVAAVTNASFALHSFKLSEPGGERNLVEIPQFSVSGASVDAVARRAEIGAVAGSGSRFALRREKDGAINAVELSKPAAGVEPAGSVAVLLESITNVVALFLNSTSAWTGIIREVNFTNCALHLEDLANSRPMRLDVDQVALAAKHISNLPGARHTVGLSARWDTNGMIRIDEEGSFSPLAAEVQVALDRLELRPLDPYLEPVADVRVLGSQLRVAGRIRLRGTESELPAVTFTGDVRLDDFSTIDGVFGDDLLKWSSLRVSGIDAKLNPPGATIREVALDDAFGRVVIESNRTINLLAALRLADTNVAAAPVAEKQPATRKDVKRPLLGALETAMSSTNAANSMSLPSVSIATVAISNAQLRFTDRSLAPAVNLTVGQAGGFIAGLSTEELRHADVNLHANVDNVGPVEITGTINPFTENRTNELKITAKSVDLTPTSPYVGKFAGYRLARGKLDLDLAYQLHGRQIKSENLIVLDQFTFGEKVNSPDATKLPVRLAIAILKDRNGKIELNVPIEGSLDDPEFRLQKVITHTLVNLLTKIATSPFAALGALLGGKGEEVAYQDFVPGSSELPPAGKEKLDTLLQALYERPALQLDVEGSVDPDADREGLQRAALEQQIRHREWASLRKSERESTRPEQVTPAPEDHLRWLKQLYSEAVTKGLINPAGAASPGTNALGRSSTGVAWAAAGGGLRRSSAGSEKGATALMRGINLPAVPAVPPQSAGTRQLTQRDPVSEAIVQALLPTVTISDGDFQALATERAKAVRDFLLQSGKLESGRVFLVESQAGGVTSKGSRTYLQLK